MALEQEAIADALTMSPLKDALDEIKQALESEQSAEGAEGSGKQEVVAMDQAGCGGPPEAGQGHLGQVDGELVRDPGS